MLLMMLWCALNETKRYTPRLVALPAVPGRLLAHLRESSGIEPGRGRGRQQQQQSLAQLMELQQSLANALAAADARETAATRTAEQRLAVALAVAQGERHGAEGRPRTIQLRCLDCFHRTRIVQSDGSS